MKKIFRIMLGMVAALMATSCSDTSELPDAPVNPGEDGDGVYMSVTVQMPTASGGSRSNTEDWGGSNHGTEEGKDYENTVSSIAVVLAEPNTNNIIAWDHIDNPSSIPSTSNPRYSATAKISKTLLGVYYEKLKGATPVQVDVFVFCNPTEGLEAALGTALQSTSSKNSWVHAVCNITENKTTATPAIWSQNSFLMNNQKIARRRLPQTLEGWKEYSESTPFNLSGQNRPGLADGIDNLNGTNTASDDNSIDDNITFGGAIQVERSVARFDFKDGSEIGNNTYNVVFDYKEDGTTIDESKPLFAVRLNRMALVNMAKQFYYLHRVSDDGTDNNWTICGNEHGIYDTYTNANYVVGPNWESFQGFEFKATEAIPNPTYDFTQYFNYPYFDNYGNIDNSSVQNDKWGTSLIADVLNRENDNYNDKTYHIWRYVTEHTLPSEGQQQKGISTGVIFKGKIIPTQYLIDNIESYPEFKDIVDNMTNNNLQGNSIDDPILYSFNGNLYMGFSSLYNDAIKKSVIFDDPNNPTKVTNVNRTLSIYKAVFGNGGLGDSFTYPYGSSNTYSDIEQLEVDDNSAFEKWEEWYGHRSTDKDNDNVLLKAMRKAVTDAGITIYQSSTDNATAENGGGAGYYCYYPYWNRHNDNGRPATMGPMEFGVVRNNVYKLSVTKISRLGHPRISDNDPDPDKPDDPDESDNVYISVSCEIIPWVVRINNIEF